ncbi:unnamed protein product [Peronospora belbahrii]|uniref:Amidohydrolase-related domain-containing protein n=1 Tax=Peronospora belbahrii TaxID=622444 RepID=A0AAU9KSV1_9STRA|nr:unnamed protein product [Peronospora belbahrii]
MSSYRLRIANARQIVQVCAHGERFKAGASQKDLVMLENASLVVDQAGKIVAIGPAAEVDKWLSAQPQP